MARKLQDSTLNNRTAREKLKSRKKPYYRLIDKGCHLGYYKGASSGTWLARRFKGEGKYEETKLGAADDKRDADGIDVLSFSQATAKAGLWFTKQARSALGCNVIGPYTVKDALDDYLFSYIQRGGKAQQDLKTRIDSAIMPLLGAIQLDRITTKQIREWHNSITTTPPRVRSKKGAVHKYKSVNNDSEYIRRRKSTANRTLTILKAALNYAYQEGKTASDEPWRRVKPFREVDTAKIRYLSNEETRRLIHACDPEFRLLVLAAILTGCRYSEIINLRTNDFDTKAATITIRISKSGKSRHVALNDEGVAFFNEQCLGLIGNDLIFKRKDGNQWGKSHQQRPLTKACNIVKIEPAVTFHILRHTYATQLIQASIPLPVIAANLGHSDTRMTSKHYAHLAPSYVANEIRTNMPKLGLLDYLDSNNVVKLRIANEFKR